MKNLKGKLYTVQVYVYDTSGREYPMGLIYLHTGKMKTEGVYTVDGDAFYVDKRGLVRNGNIETENGCYYADISGRLVKGFAGGKFYTGEDYRIITGWFTESGQTFYSGADGRVVTGKRLIDGKLYTFSSYGALMP